VNRGFATFISLAFLSAAFVVSGCRMAHRLTPEHRQSQNLRWLLIWLLKGLVLPISLWALLNVGLSWSLQPFMPEVQFAQNSGGPWAGSFFQVVGYGMFIVSSYWTALTLCWAVRKATKGIQGEQRSDFKGLCVTCLLALSLPALGIAWLGGLPILGLAASAIIGPIAGYTPNILRTRKTPPMYARAVARIKFGKYKDAEWEIIRELEKCEEDFEGWMMLAELYAKNFNDVGEAEQTVLEICDHPGTTPSQLSIALHRLSDWHLNLAGDPEAARRDLQMICERLPGTHLAHMAQLRMNQLPETLEQLRELRNPKPIPLPEGPHFMDAVIAERKSELERTEAAEQANACVEKLTVDPNDVPARENLARVLAERLQKVDEGLEQLKLLLNLPAQTDRQRAEWLLLAATWHINYRQDYDTGRHLLERVIREFPQTPDALAARRKMQALDVQYRG
jgi:hypothetical protein